jgi:hypothetical protein
MTSAGGWLRNAGAAARVAAERGDLWLPGALASLTYLAWLPLVLTVAVLPRTSDLAFLGASLFGSEIFPLNVVLIAVLAALGMLVACLLAAFAEASLLRAMGLGTPDRSMARELEVIFSVMMVAVLPAVTVAAGLISAAAAVAPAEFAAPDLGLPLALRIALRLTPLLFALVVAAWLGQAFGAIAMRRAVGRDARPLGSASRAALRDLIQHPMQRLGVALTALLADLVAVVLAVALLRVLWAPIAADLGAGQLISPQALLLLVGFVAIWLAVILAFGALHVWISTWWSLELGAVGERAPIEPREAQS